MGRRFVVLVLAGVVVGCAIVGCSPQGGGVGGGTGPGAGVSIPASVPGATGVVTQATRPGTPAARKTVTRDELKAWLQPIEMPDGKWIRKSPADVKARLGPPDSSREVEQFPPGVNNPALIKYLVFTYKNLSVDAKGSGKVDAECRIYFNNDLVKPDMTEFVP